MKRLLALLGKRPAVTDFTAPLRPDTALVAIGDVHGCLDAFQALLAQIDARFPGCPIVCVGDLVDRGEHSAATLDLAFARARQGGFICLKGNHEEMMLQFLDDPQRRGPRWLRHGGLQTLASFGVQKTGDESLTDLRDRLVEAISPEVVTWLRALPLSWSSGNVFVTHAAADPLRAITKQDEQTMLWGHPKFFQRVRTDGIWVVHGHTIVDLPSAMHGRIALDTGAFGTGRLSAAHISAEGVTFLESDVAHRSGAQG